jgi:DNA-binding NarL/FixJ family response regulator
MLAARREDDTVRQALTAGARGFALQQQPSGEIFEAIHAVARGQSYLAPGIAQVVLDDALRLRRGQSATPGPCDALSAREREVFDLLIRGNSTQQIARLLCISAKTVETHRARVFQKIGVHSLVDLVRFAARNQLPLD